MSLQQERDQTEGYNNSVTSDGWEWRVSGTGINGRADEWVLKYHLSEMLIGVCTQFL